MSKWKEIESYLESKSFHESKFNINKKQAQMILDLKKDELKKMRFLAMLDIDKDELKQLAKKDPSIVRAIGKQGGSFRTAMVRKRANEEVKEDAPTNFAGAGSGVDFNPTGMSLKKKKELDARTKEYKIHARKLVAQREKRLKKKEMIKGSFVKGIKENMSGFAREKFIVEKDLKDFINMSNVDILGQIVRRKQAMPLKFKDGQMKIDMNTANAILKNLVNAPANMMKGSTRTKVMDIINKGRKAQFLRLIDMLYK